MDATRAAGPPLTANGGCRALVGTGFSPWPPSCAPLQGMDVIRSAGASGAIVAGDNFGRLTFLDPRAQSPIARVQVHKASNGKASAGRREKPPLLPSSQRPRGQQPAGHRPPALRAPLSRCRSLTPCPTHAGSVGALQPSGWKPGHVCRQRLHRQDTGRPPAAGRCVQVCVRVCGQPAGWLCAAAAAAARLPLAASVCAHLLHLPPCPRPPARRCAPQAPRRRTRARRRWAAWRRRRPPRWPCCSTARSSTRPASASSQVGAGLPALLPGLEPLQQPGRRAVSAAARPPPITPLGRRPQDPDHQPGQPAASVGLPVRC